MLQKSRNMPQAQLIVSLNSFSGESIAYQSLGNLQLSHQQGTSASKGLRNFIDIVTSLEQIRLRKN
jgi:hypothetical protein